MSYISQYTGQEIDNAIANSASKEYVNQQIATLQTEINKKTELNIDNIYPVGSIYMSLSSTSPATFIGGTWEQIKDTFLLGAGSAAAGATGGASNHTHNYGLKYGSYYRDVALEMNTNAGILSYQEDGTYTISNSTTNVGNLKAQINSNSASNYTTVSMSHYIAQGNVSYTDNMPPYLAVYMWKRIS